MGWVFGAFPGGSCWLARGGSACTRLNVCRMRSELAFVGGCPEQLSSCGAIDRIDSCADHEETRGRDGRTLGDATP